MRIPRFRIGSSLIVGVFFVCSVSIASANISYSSTVATATGLTALQGLWVTSTGDMYVVNAGTTTNSRILHFNASGTLLTSRTITGALPRTINVDPTTGYVYVTGSGKLLQYTDFDHSSAYNAVITSGLSVSTLAPAQGMIFNADRTKVYVGTSTATVKIYNTSDWSLYQTLSLPSAANTNDPGPMALDSSGNLYVVDYRTTTVGSPVGNGRIVKFTAGSLTGINFKSGYIDTNNAGAADSPSGIFIDAHNVIYVLLRGSKAGGDGAIYKYDGSGNLVTSLRTSNTGILNLPISGISVDGSGSIYAVNSGGGTIKKFVQSIDPPYNFTGNAAENTAVLSWTAIDDSRLDSFTIRRSTSSYPETVADGTPVTSGLTAHSYTDTGLTPYTRYYYSVFSKDTNGNYSDPDYVYVDAGTLDPPSDVSYSNTSTTATLSWTNSTAPEFASVTIRRGASGFPSTVSDGSEVATDFTGTSYTDTGLTAGATYYYSLFTKDVNGVVSSNATTLTVLMNNVCDMKTYWQFDATPESPVDGTGHGWRGDTYGAAPSLSTDVPTTGLVNPYSFAFDGNDFIEFGRPVEDDFSICSWIKTTAVGDGTGTEHYKSMGIAHAETAFEADDFGFGVDADGHLVFGDGNIFRDYAVHGATAVNTGNWVHACMTRSKASGVMKVYVNGVLDGSGVGSNATLSSNPTLTIGNGPNGGMYWNGLLDGIRVYDFVLTADAIHSLATGVNACFGDIVLPTATSATTAATTDSSHQSNGGRRGNSTTMIVQTLEKKTAGTPAAHPAAPVHHPASSPSPAATSSAMQVLGTTQARLESRVAQQIAAKPGSAPALKKMLARMVARIAKLSAHGKK